MHDQHPYPEGKEMGARTELPHPVLVEEFLTLFNAIFTLHGTYGIFFKIPVDDDSGPSESFLQMKHPLFHRSSLTKRRSKTIVIVAGLAFALVSQTFAAPTPTPSPTPVQRGRKTPPPPPTRTPYSG